MSDVDDAPKGGKKKRGKKPVSRRRKIIKRVIIALVVVILLVVGWFAYRALMAGKSVFKGDLLGFVQQKP